MNIRKELPDFTKGPIIKSLLTLSIPIIFANLLQTAYQLVDTFWVGRLGAEAVAAVSISFPVMFLLISLGGGLAIAGTIMVAQYKGKGDLKQVDHVSAQTLIMMIFVAVIFSIIGYFLSAPVLQLMGAEQDVLPQAVSYLQISFIGMIFLFSYFVFQSLMRGVGDVKTPMYIVLFTVFLNLIFDPLFIFGWGPVPSFGVAGAAVATIGTQGIAATIGLFILFSGKYGIRLKKSHIKLDFKLMKKMFLLGFPSSIEQSTRALGMTIMTFLVASFGTLVIASYGIGTRILSFIIIPAMGISMSTGTLVGQNIGAQKIDRAEKITNKALLLAFIVLTIAGILLFIFAEPVIALFIPNDPDVIKMGAVFVRIMSLSFGFIGAQQTLNGAFMGSGNTKTSMMLSMVSLWIFQFPLAYILSKHTSLGINGLWMAFPAANVLATITAYIWFKKGDWKKKKIIHEPVETLKQDVLEETIIEEGF